MRILQPTRRGANAQKGSSKLNSNDSNASESNELEDGSRASSARSAGGAESRLRSSSRKHGSVHQSVESERKPSRQAKGAALASDELEPLVALDQLPPGKKRRRSELAGVTSQASSQPLELVVDPAKKEFNELFARGVRLLAMREHSVKEITNKLLDKTDRSDLVPAVVEQLLENKYLSDERFTESYIRARANRGFGPVKIRSELKSKGISSVLIQEHLNESSGLWLDNATTQYQKKYGDTPVSDYNTWTKRARFMQSRGFTMEHIHVTIPSVEFD